MNGPTDKKQMNSYMIKTALTAIAGAFILVCSACTQDNEEPQLPPQLDNQEQTGGSNEENDDELTQEQREIADFLDRRNKAMVDRDIETLRSLMADDLVLIHMSGQTQSKEEWLEEIKNETMRYYSIEMEDLHITVDGNRATATYTSIMDARIWGSRGTWRMNSTMNLEQTEPRGWLWTTSGRPQSN